MGLGVGGAARILCRCIWLALTLSPSAASENVPVPTVGVECGRSNLFALTGFKGSEPPRRHDGGAGMLGGLARLPLYRGVGATRDWWLGASREMVRRNAGRLLDVGLGHDFVRYRGVVGGGGLEYGVERGSERSVGDWPNVEPPRI